MKRSFNLCIEKKQNFHNVISKHIKNVVRFEIYHDIVISTEYIERDE